MLLLRLLSLGFMAMGMEENQPINQAMENKVDMTVHNDYSMTPGLFDSIGNASKILTKTTKIQNIRKLKNLLTTWKKSTTVPVIMSVSQTDDVYAVLHDLMTSTDKFIKFKEAETIYNDFIFNETKDEEEDNGKKFFKKMMSTKKDTLVITYQPSERKMHGWNFNAIVLNSKENDGKRFMVSVHSGRYVEVVEIKEEHMSLPHLFDRFSNNEYLGQMYLHKIEYNDQHGYWVVGCGITHYGTYHRGESTNVRAMKKEAIEEKWHMISIDGTISDALSSKRRELILMIYALSSKCLDSKSKEEMPYIFAYDFVRYVIAPFFGNVVKSTPFSIRKKLFKNLSNSK